MNFKEPKNPEKRTFIEKMRIIVSIEIVICLFAATFDFVTHYDLVMFLIGIELVLVGVIFLELTKKKELIV